MGYAVDPKNYPSGFVYKGKVYLNMTGYGNKIGIDTPIHELGHIYIMDLIRYNPKAYRELVKELKSTQEGRAIIAAIRLQREKSKEGKFVYGTEEDIIEEAVVAYIGVIGARVISGKATVQEKTLFERFIAWIRYFFNIRSQKEKLTLEDIAREIVGERKITVDITEEQEDAIMEEYIHCFGNKAREGMDMGFTNGGRWEIIKELKGNKHSQGGIDISIDNGKVYFSNKNNKIHAQYGLVIAGD